MKTLKLGLISSPGLPAELTSKIVDDLPDFLKRQVDQHISWKPEIVIDPLVGSAEYMNQLMDKVIDLKNKNNWDYVICLTDLPHFMEKHIIMADINREQKVTLISIPSFGLFPVKRRIKQTISQVMQEMYSNNDKNTHTEVMTRKTYRQHKKKDENRPFWSVQRVAISRGTETENEQDETNAEAVHQQDQHEGEEKETQQDTEHRSDIRYIIQSRLLGQFRILAGMVFANRPWTALSSFKKVLMLAFGTGVYITIFPTPWELSTIYSIPRFLTLMTAAIVAMVVWMIFAHNLWEKPTKKGDKRLRNLYNVTTASTLGIIVLINYIVLFCLFLATLYLFVPSDLFEASTGIGKNPPFKYYLQLTWLSTSLGTLAGSIGTTAEDEEAIRDITYSYRQINRYYEIRDEEDDENKAYDKESYET